MLEKHRNQLLKVERLNKIEALKKLAFEKKSFDGFLVTNPANLLYFTGFEGAFCLLIPKKGESTIYVYSLNYALAKAEGKDFKIEEVKRGEKVGEKIAAQVKASKIKKLASDMLSYDIYRMFAKALRGTAKLNVRGDLIWELRKVKNEQELELMRKAGELTVTGMKAAYETIKPGVKEIEVAAEIEYAMRRKGSWGTAFESIVASGARSAYPHGGCTDKEIRKGDIVVVDIGATYQCYRSDMTRTLVAGKPTQKQEKLYEVVRVAQEKAFQAIKPNVKGKDVDGVARKSIADAGYGEYFVHGLGHGVGLEVHELPVLSPAGKDRLKVGNVVTNEPGIYLVGYGGFRIEDTVLVKPRRAEKLVDGFYTLTAER
jgi:Xaa-Pro aminopeptidase